MLTVHHLQVSQSDRIVWLCEELGIPYELVLYSRDPQTRMAPEAYKALHPAGTAPVIFDGPLVLSESGAIIDYLIGKFGEGSSAKALSPTYPDADFAPYLFWFHFAGSSMMPRLLTSMILARVNPAPGANMFGARVDAAFDMVEKRLGEASYFAGERFTAADIMMVFPLTTMRLFAPRDLTPYPNILRYLQRIGERPAYRAAMAKGHPDLPLNLI
jgi:glutathione S-transferase